jgi:hypothetical protein
MPATKAPSAEVLQTAQALLATLQPQAQQRMTLSGVVTPFGCCNFFDACTDDIMRLSYGGAFPLLDWMGFNVSDECYRTVEFMSFNQPADGTSAGYISDPCASPNGIETGFCKLTIEDFGRYGRMGPVRSIMKPERYCQTSPRRRLDGTIISSEQEWDMVFAMDQVVVDIKKHMITGNATTGGQFDGLERLVKTGYDCTMLDSIVINWNGNPMSGGAGITWNGAAVGATYNFIDVLLAAYRRVKQRISWAPVLAPQSINTGDMIIVLPYSMIDCLLDHYTCWSVCDGSQYNEVALQSYEARQFRNGLLGGMFGAGQITLDGQLIPIMGYDWNLIKGPKTGDIYFLTGSVGAIRVWEGEHLSASAAAAQYSTHGYFSKDGGRVLGKVDTDNECMTLKLWMHPRIFLRAPFLQIRFQAVQCDKPGGFISPDPTETSFYPETSFCVDPCP